jgi:KipI family sensor histidine kinase inhibitor
MKFSRAGDSAFFIKTGNDISIELSLLNRVIIDEFNRLKPRGVIECVASYTGVMVYYDPLIIRYEELTSIAGEIRTEKNGTDVFQNEGIVIPVAYGGEYGPDINHVAGINGLTPGEVAVIHTTGIYTVHMLGFTPGFPYLGGMDPRLSAPRKKEPSLHIEAGSVGIAGNQTGIYPVESPGGWHIIGRTPLIIFDPARKPEFLLRAGEKVRFRAVDNYEFWNICEMTQNGEYNIERF